MAYWKNGLMKEWLIEIVAFESVVYWKCGLLKVWLIESVAYW